MDNSKAAHRVSIDWATHGAAYNPVARTEHSKCIEPSRRMQATPHRSIARVRCKGNSTAVSLASHALPPAVE